MKIIRLFFKLFYDSAQYVFYTWQGPHPTPQAVLHPNIHTYTYGSQGLMAFGKIWKNKWLQPLYYRFRNKHATLLTLEEGGKVVAYGWVQSWQPFYRKFGAIFPEATMLGPYWTAPSHRGRGVYKTLLYRSLTLCEPDKPVAIYTSPGNIASQRGIKGAGFQYIGTYRVQLFFRCWPVVRKCSVNQPL